MTSKEWWEREGVRIGRSFKAEAAERLPGYWGE